MSGVTWGHRNEGDWLASNGRWYPKSSYPRSWNRSSLPPAPDHESPRSVTDVVSSAASRMQELAGIASGTAGSSTEPFADKPVTLADLDPTVDKAYKRPTYTRPTYTRPTQPPRPTYTRPAPPARATVTSQRTHTSRVGAGAPPAKGLPAPTGGLPPSPGRVSPDAVDLDSAHPPPPGSPTATRPATVKPPMPSVGSPGGGDNTETNVVAGDLGRVFGSAKKRLEQAMEELE